MIQSKEIVDYYDQCENHYRTHWNLAESLAIHYGYWDETTKTFHEALTKINDILAKKAGITATDRVLDAGCGIGGSSIYLAQNIGCQSVGISLSERQIASARRIAAERGVSEHTHFEAQDFTKTNFKSESFDVVWAIESVCHANQKADFLGEAYRLLKPNGRLIIADFFKTKAHFSPKENRILSEWAKGWAVPDFESVSHFQELMQQRHFSKIQTQNITPHILPSAKRLYIRFFPGWVYAKTYHYLFKTASLTMDNVWTAYWQYKGLQKKLWEYHIVEAVK